MGVVHERWCRPGGYKRFHVADLLRPDRQGHPPKQARTVGVMEAGVLRLADPHAALGCTRIAMASPNVSLRLVGNRLDDSVWVLPVNAWPAERGRGQTTEGVRMLPRWLTS